MPAEALLLFDEKEVAAIATGYSDRKSRQARSGTE